MDRITSQLKSLILWSTYALHSEIPYEHTHTCTPSSPHPLPRRRSDSLIPLLWSTAQDHEGADGEHHEGSCWDAARPAYLYGALLYYLLLTKQEGGEGRKEGVWSGCTITTVLKGFLNS